MGFILPFLTQIPHVRLRFVKLLASDRSIVLPERHDGVIRKRPAGIAIAMTFLVFLLFTQITHPWLRFGRSREPRRMALDPVSQSAKRSRLMIGRFAVPT